MCSTSCSRSPCPDYYQRVVVHNPDSIAMLYDKSPPPIAPETGSIAAEAMRKLPHARVTVHGGKGRLRGCTADCILGPFAESIELSVLYQIILPMSTQTSRMVFISSSQAEFIGDLVPEIAWRAPAPPAAPTAEPTAPPTAEQQWPDIAIARLKIAS